MFRSIFTLLYKIAELDRVDRKTEKSSNKTRRMSVVNDQQQPVAGEAKSFQITNEVGDVITCKHKAPVTVVPKSVGETTEGDPKHKFVTERKSRGRTSFINDREDTKIGKKPATAPEDSQDLSAMFFKTSKDLRKIESRDIDELSGMIERVNKMKMGIDRLKQIAHDFNCLDRFKEDVDYLMKNVGPALLESDNLCNKFMAKKKQIDDK